MFTQIARCAIRAPRRILFGMAALALLGGVFGSSVAGHLGSGGFIDPQAESAVAQRLLIREYPAGAPNLILLITSADGVDSPDARAAGERVVAALRTYKDVTGVSSYWEAPPELAVMYRSIDGHSALVNCRVAGDDTQAAKRSGAIADKLTVKYGPVTVLAGGEAMGYHEITSQVTKDLARAETLVIPITGLLLIFIFGSVIAAMIPLAVGITSILVTLGILRVLSALTDVSVFAMNISVALGLALAVDYSLFTVSRFREELAHGVAVEDAVVRTVRTAGRTVFFAALPIALSLSALVLFRPYIMRSFAYAGVCTVTAVVVASLFAVPAALVLLGPKVDALDARIAVRRLIGRRSQVNRREDTGVIYRFVAYVCRFPGFAVIAVISLLLLLGAPFLSVKFGYTDDRVIAPGAQSRQVGDVLRSNFALNANEPMFVVLPNYSGASSAITAYAKEISLIDGVVIVNSANGAFAHGMLTGPPIPQMATPAATFLTIGTNVDPFSQAGREQLATLRVVPQPGHTLFAGPAAFNADSLQSLRSALPLAAALIALATYISLFIFTRSAVLPLKALLLNTLSLCATFGAMVWVFQEGNLSNVLGFTPTGYLPPPMPILMFCLAFGISMDYEVFILARVREEWLSSVGTSADHVRAIVLGVARTGRIITAAAALMAVVFGAIIYSKVSFMQMFGLGLTLMVIVDTLFVRLILVPSFMQLMGEINWWAPKLIRHSDRDIVPDSSAKEEISAIYRSEDDS